MERELGLESVDQRERDWRQRKQREQESLSCSFRGGVSFKLESNGLFFFFFLLFKKRTLISALFQPFMDQISLRLNKKSGKKGFAMDVRATTSTVARCVRACQTQVRHPWRHTRAFLSLKTVLFFFFFFNNYKKNYFSFLYIPFSFWVFLIFWGGGICCKRVCKCLVWAIQFPFSFGIFFIIKLLFQGLLGKFNFLFCLTDKK